VIAWLRQRWRGEGGCGHVLALALPMILSTASMSIQRFVDRMFLGWYDPNCLAASSPSGAAAFTIACLFLGTAGYVNTFVAQYTGARQSHRVGGAIWQGVYFSLIATVVLIVSSRFAEPLFQLAGHDRAIRQLELDYFRILTLGSGFGVMSATLAGFYSGRGRMQVVMWVNVAKTVVNIVLNWCWVFGNLGFPEMGMRGAAWATVVAMGFSLVVYLVLFWLPHNRREFGTASQWGFNPRLFGRLLRFGLPSGIHFFVDVFAFTIFLFIAGRLGTKQLAATNIAFTLNMLIFMPMIGFAVAISTLVGQALGQNRPDLARRSTTSAALMAMAYMAVGAGLFVLVPDPFINVFRPLPPNVKALVFRSLSPEVDFAEVRSFARVLLLFVAAYSVFDVANITYAAALRGAGDTLFPMLACLAIAFGGMVLPVWFLVEFRGAGLYTAWSFVTLWVIGMGAVCFVRYLGGKWETMRVIEAVSAPDASLQAGPLVEVDTHRLAPEPDRD